ITVQVHDPLADPLAALKEYGMTLKEDLAVADAVVLAVAHDLYRTSGWPLITRLLKEGRGLVMDVKGALNPLERPPGIEGSRLWAMDPSGRARGFDVCAANRTKEEESHF